MKMKTLEAISEAKSVGVEERVQRFLSAIKARDGKVGAFVEVYSDWAVEQAKGVDAKAKAGKPLGKLAGLVFSIKNNVAIRGRRLSCASKMLEHYVAPYTATTVERILAADGIIICSANLDEFCCGSDCSRSALQVTRNPLDLSRVPG